MDPPPGVSTEPIGLPPWLWLIVSAATRKRSFCPSARFHYQLRPVSIGSDPGDSKVIVRVRRVIPALGNCRLACGKRDPRPARLET